jgi:2'-5' RNA ligase
MPSQRSTTSRRQDVCAPGKTETSETWRVFIAIELPRTLRARIAEHTKELRDPVSYARASWAREENLHLTLKFLGEIHVAEVEALSEAIKTAAHANEKFDFRIGDCGAFPPAGQPRVLWIGVEDESGKLAHLYEALENECATAGFTREARSFHPHLTIARLRQPHGSRQLAQLHKERGFVSETISVSELVVIRSELSSQGSRYTVVARHHLS